ncbi:MAG: hypothetical protein B7C54_11650 [Acidimicrobiales bacterium mtb01]|nr:hypothetical protein [Actinomycetota bacterium]TEX45701.1 MAG: hypothetical protein B7C54_11650 [Acidimicrobiales bacterium mtb01]
MRAPVATDARTSGVDLPPHLIDHVDAITGLWRDACRGPGNVVIVVVCGWAGSGKTSLLRASGERVRREAGSVLIGANRAAETLSNSQCCEADGEAFFAVVDDLTAADSRLLSDALNCRSARAQAVILVSASGADGASAVASLKSDSRVRFVEVALTSWPAETLRQVLASAHTGLDDDHLDEVLRCGPLVPALAIEASQQLKEAAETSVAESVHLERSLRSLRVAAGLLGAEPATIEVARMIAIDESGAIDNAETVERVLSLGSPTATRALEDLLYRGIIHSARATGRRGYEFVSSAMRTAVMRSMTECRVAAAHRLLAEELDRRRLAGHRIDPSALARHLLRSGESHPDACHILLDAVQHSSRPCSPEVERWLQVAIDELGRRKPQPLETYERMARLLLRLGKPREALDVISRVASKGSLSDTSRYLASDALMHLGQFGNALDALNQADNTVSAGVEDGVRRSVLLSALGRAAESEACANDLLVRCDDTSVRAVALGQLAQSAADRGDLARMYRLLRQQQSTLALAASEQRAVTAALSANLLLANGLVEEAESLVHSAGLPNGSAPGYELWTSALVHLQALRGRWPEALELASEAIRETEPRDPRPAVGLTRVIAAEIQANQGQVANALELLPTSPGLPVSLAAACALVRTGCGLAGDRSELQDLVPYLMERDGIPAMIRLRVLSLLAEPGSDFQGLTVQSGYLERWLRCSFPLPRAIALRISASLTGDVDAAREALDLSYSSPFEAARTHWILGRLGDSPDLHLGTALEMFERLGAEVPARQVVTEMRRRDIRTSQRRRGDSALSAVERDVASMVQQGFSNREIAERLCYSRKTIELYLSRIYSKTGCRTRLDLARMLDRGEL